MLKLGRYWPWKTVSSHLNKSQKNCCCYHTKCKDYVKVCHILFPFVFNPVASCALEPNYQGMVLTVTILILSGFIFDSSYDLIMLCLCVFLERKLTQMRMKPFQKVKKLMIHFISPYKRSPVVSDFIKTD